MSICAGMGEDEVSQVIDLLYMALQLKGIFSDAAVGCNSEN